MFYKFRCAVARFMYGRNGMDQMNQALLRGYLVILVAQLIFSLLRLWIPARICESLLWVLMIQKISCAAVTEAGDSCER